MAHEQIFSALADPTRRRLLEALREDSRSVGSLVEALGVSQPTVSKHLKVLREAGLITMRAEGQRRYYALEPAAFVELHGWLQPYLPPVPAPAVVPDPFHDSAVVSQDATHQATVAAAQLGRTVGRGLEQVTGRAQDFLERLPKPKFGRKR
ncbi:MAG: metalloregulator ArsR/SmtB family transcription factor [Micrococcaceae bacterium]|nr:metalloregulator ArsR/SmtB family transcription factor [Micrococcaceae bacterium]